MKKWINGILTSWGIKIASKKLNKMATKKNSNNTTILGVAAIVTMLAAAAKVWFDGDPSTVVDFGILIPALMTALIGIFGKDSNASHSAKPTTAA